MAELRVSGNGTDGRKGVRGQALDVVGRSCPRDAISEPHGLAVDLLVGALLGEQTQLVRRICAALTAELAVYRSMPVEDLGNEVGFEVGLVLRSVAGGQDAAIENEQCVLASLGAQRARQGVPVDDMLRAWRISLHVVIGCAHEVARRLGIPDSDVLTFVQAALAWSDRILVRITRAYREADRVVSGEQQASFVRKVLLGTMSCAEAAIEAELFGLDPGREYVAIRARFREEGSRLELEQALGLQQSVQHRRGLCAVIDGYAAGFLTEAPPHHIDAVIGVGPPRPLTRLAESYRLALRAMATAEACQLTGAYDIASLGLRPAVALDADVGEHLRRRYLEPLAKANSGSELIETLRTYLACGTHVERTATRLFVHQNTVRYRIARFEELTGASLGDIEVLFEVWWALELSAMSL